MQLRAFPLLFTIAFLFVSVATAQLDPSFGTNGLSIYGAPGISDYTIASFVLPDGKILVVSRDGVSSRRTFFLRFNANGTPDTTYGTNGVVEIPVPYSAQIQGYINSAARQADGKIVLVGADNISSSIVTRFNENGTLDTSFAGIGVHRPNIAPSGDDELLRVIIQPDGKILASGYGNVSPNDRLTLVRYLPNGQLDPSLGGGGFFIYPDVRIPTGWDEQVLFVNSAGKILVGNSKEVSSTGTIRRFNFDGSVDGSFTIIPFRSIDNFIRTIAFLQPDDKILVGTVVNRTETLARVHDDIHVKRFNSDGTPDTGFGTAGSVSFDLTSYQYDEPLGFQVLSDGQIIVALETGIPINRTKWAGNLLSYARLSSSGTVNGKFLATGVTGTVRNPSFTSIQPDGKIVTAFTFGSDILLVRAVSVPLQTYTLHALPYNFPSAAAGVYSKPSLFRPSDASWRVYPTSTGSFGESTDIPVSGDFVGSLLPDFAFFRPSNGTWYISNANTGVLSSVMTVQWGASGDIPVPADYDGDGKSDISVFRPSNGTWWIRNSSDESYRSLQWGVNGDKPAVGDFDGDQIYDVAVFRPSDGNWYIIRSSDNGFTILHFGLEGDIPVQEDYDDDEKFDIAVYRPSTGVWYRMNSSDGAFVALQWGLAGDIPVPAEYDRDGKMNIAVWRPSNGYWYILNPDNSSMHFYIWGNPTDIPLPGKF